MKRPRAKSASSGAGVNVEALLAKLKSGKRAPAPIRAKLPKKASKQPPRRVDAPEPRGKLAASGLTRTKLGPSAVTSVSRPARVDAPAPIAPAVFKPLSGARPSSTQTTARVPPVTSSSRGLSALQASMRDKLGGSRFRWINEQLYTQSGAAAAEMMAEDSTVFDEYHSGFRKQASAWPSQPLDGILDSLGALEAGSVIVDLGCGDARLASALIERGSSHRVISFDLVSHQPAVVAAQCTSLVPLPGAESAIVDAVVICLALMGSDWIGMIKEARRIMRPYGRLYIAEVTSRISDRRALIRVIELAGFQLTAEDSTNTHFIRLDFECSRLGGLAPADEQRAATLLAPCSYKRR